MRPLSAGLRSGAPLKTILHALADTLLAEHAAEHMRRVRRLPGLLAFPVALLVLPGFVLMVMGPTVATLVREMLEPWIGAG